MKKILLSLFIISAGFTATAQELAPDQNPNYKQSLEKYLAAKDNLQATMNTTVQSTYKAYDWSTAKSERKAERRNDRRENRRYNGVNNYNQYGYNQPYYGPGNGYYYYPSPNYNYYNGRRWRW
ncbi:MAG: hypothetical protein WKF88_01740 [Ferruginibacter sp.]